MKLRKAQMEDALEVLRWRNDESTRKNSFNHDEISEESHLNWFKTKLEDRKCFMFILEDDSKPVGSVRVDVVDETGEISYMIAPESRGKGYGNAALELLNMEKDIEELRALVGFVDTTNTASAKCFEKNGYSKLYAGNINCYIKIR